MRKMQIPNKETELRFVIRSHFRGSANNGTTEERKAHEALTNSLMTLLACLKTACAFIPLCPRKLRLSASKGPVSNRIPNNEDHREELFIKKGEKKAHNFQVI